MRKWLISLSRLANRFVYKEPCMVCASAYWHNKPTVVWFDRLFYWQKEHSYRCFSYEFQNNPVYYKHVMDGLKADREKFMTESWEQDFTNPPRIPPPSICAQCGDLVHDDDVIRKQFYNGQMVIVQPFCSHDCHHIFYINHLNKGGLNA